MTTPRDLFIVSLDKATDHPVERGDLSLALAGAEAIDLLDAHAIRLDGDHIVPVDQPAIADPRLAEAASSIARQQPYESVSDWLWRRGRNLSAAYLADLEADGQVTRQQRRRWLLFRTTRTELVDSPDRRHAGDRWASDEPVLASLAAAAGVPDKRSGEAPGAPDADVEAVLTAVDEAVDELIAERRRRARRLEEAADNNRRRGW